MNGQERFRDCLQAMPIVAILRGIMPAEVVAVCDQLYAAGITGLEIPLNSPDALESIGLAVKHGGDRLVVGAGTVITPADVDAVAAAGGQFIVSPNTDPEVIWETVANGMVSVPGFLTPSEAFAALKAGAHYLKLFPAGPFGCPYVRDLQAVVKAPILAVGGVGADNMADFLRLCAGVGVGSALYKPGSSPAEVGARARELTARCRQLGGAGGQGAGKGRNPARPAGA